MKKPLFSPDAFKFYHMDLYHAPGGLSEPEIMAKIAESIFEEWLALQPIVCNNGFSSYWSIREGEAFPSDIYTGRLVNVQRKEGQGNG